MTKNEINLAPAPAPRQGIRAVWALGFLVGVFLCFFSAYTFVYFTQLSRTGEEVVEDYWETTDLDKESLRAYITTDSCYRERISFFGCLTALESLGAFQKDTDVELRFQFDAHEDSITLEFVPQDSPRYTDITALLSFVSEKSLQKQEAWESLYQETRNQRIPFTPMIEAIIDSLSGTDPISGEPSEEFSLGYSAQKLIAESLNSYFSIVHSPHDGLIPQMELFDEMESSDEEEFLGIGVNLTVIADHLVVVRTVPQSPAAQAGLQAGDIITHIQGESVEGMLNGQALQSIAQSDDMQVHLKWMRENVAFEAVLQKEEQSTANVQTSMITDENRTWGIVKVDSFESSNTCEATKSAIAKLEGSAVQGIVLDLRDNPGGLLDQALCMIDLFLPSGQLVLQVQPVAHTEGLHHFSPESMFATESYYTEKVQVTQLPLAILLNSGSASASEVVAGALKEAQRASIIGERSYGKGTILQAKDFETAEYFHPSVLHFFTVATFHFASGDTNHLVGVQPDLAHAGLSTPVDFPREEDLFYYQIRTKKAVLPMPAVQHQTAAVLAQQRPLFAESRTQCLQKLRAERAAQPRQPVLPAISGEAYINTAVHLLGCLRAESI